MENKIPKKVKSPIEAKKEAITAPLKEANFTADASPEKKEKSPVAFIVMFTILDSKFGIPHKHWRISQFPTKELFDLYLSKQISHPKVLERKWFKVDLASGTITPEK